MPLCPRAPQRTSLQTMLRLGPVPEAAGATAWEASRAATGVLHSTTVSLRLRSSHLLKRIPPQLPQTLLGLRELASQRRRA